MYIEIKDLKNAFNYINYIDEHIKLYGELKNRYTNFKNEILELEDDIKEVIHKRPLQLEREEGF